MDHFSYRDGHLHAEDVAISQIAAQVGTPFYLYSSATLLRHFKLFDEALAGMDHLICYAMKAASNQAILTLLGAAGAGMDVVSGGEYARARAAGIPGDRIVFSGVGKTRAEMIEVLTGGVRQFNVESEPELHVLSQVASMLGKTAPITIRVNPDVDAKTHAKISTGKKEDKFGIPISRAREVYAMAARLPGLEVVGIDVHIGSQLTDLAPYGMAYDKVTELTEVLRADGHDIRRLDLGGGLGIPYESNNQHPPSPQEYCVIDPQDEKTYPLFGDAAGAVLLVRDPQESGAENRGILANRMGTVGELGHLISVPGSCSRMPASQQVLTDRMQFLKMDGRPVFKWAVRTIPAVVNETLDLASLKIDDIDVLLFHQANMRIIEAALADTDIPRDKVFTNLQRYGNTSAASIPLLLDEAVEQNICTLESTLLMCGFGAGLTWGSCIYQG